MDKCSSVRTTLVIIVFLFAVQYLVVWFWNLTALPGAYMEVRKNSRKRSPIQNRAGINDNTIVVFPSK